MRKAITLVGLAAAASLAGHAAPASAYKWVTMSGSACTSRGLVSKCEVYMPERFKPAKGTDEKAFRRAEALQLAQARQACDKRGGKWRMFGESAVCAPGFPRQS